MFSRAFRKQPRTKGMVKMPLLLCFIGQFLASFARASFDSPCAKFRFPFLKGSSLTATKGDNVTISFDLNFEDCSGLLDFSVKVTKVAGQSRTRQCVLIHKNRQCKEPVNMPECKCRGRSGMYELTHTADRSDNFPTTWVWSTSDPAIESQNITFDVLYPAEVTNLTVYDHQGEPTAYVENNRQVEVVCLWENGHPRVSARLLDRHGVVMGREKYTGQISFMFPAVSCQDAGIIRCEAPGASHNMTVPLLVRCAPEISLVETFTDANDTISMKLAVRAPTADFHKCRLRKLRVETACSVTDVSGTPPDLMLTVQSDNMTSQDHGYWRLELTNDVGTGHLEINLKETESTTSSESIESTDTHQHDAQEVDGGQPAWMTAIAAVALTVMVIFIAVCREFRRKSAGQNAGQPLPIEDLVMRERENVALEEHGSRQSAHYYMEVPDSPPPSDQSSTADAEPPPLPCHGPENPPEDYLIPEPSRDETKEEGAEWNTVPFYQNTQLRNMQPEENPSMQRPGSGSSQCMDNVASDDSFHDKVSAFGDSSHAPVADVGRDDTGYVPYAP